jgi:hypothetical protein
MSKVAIELWLESGQYERLAAVARAQQRSLAKVVQAALAEWLADQEKQEQARQCMRKLVQGWDQGPADGRF